VALAALIAARKECNGAPGALCAALPIAGRTLVEHQARLAARAGARHIVILVGALPPQLMAAIDRMRRDGIGVEIARDLNDAVDRIHPEEALLLFAEGLVTGADLIERMAELPAPAILTLPDEPATAAFERIDAADRWGGLLLTDGTRLRGTAAMLGDWDLESTLLRRAVQEGAERVRPEAHDHVVIASSPEVLDGIDDALFAGSRRSAADWPGQWIHPLIERLAVPSLLRRGVDPATPAAVAMGLAAAGALAMVIGWTLTGFLLMLLAAPVASIASRIAAARLAEPRMERLAARVRHWSGAAGIAGLAWSLAPHDGWGLYALAALLLLAVAAVEAERALVLRLPGGRPPRWLASLDGLLWAALPFAISGEWGRGLLALTAYAVASFFFLQREVGLRVARLADQA